MTKQNFLDQLRINLRMIHLYVTKLSIVLDFKSIIVNILLDTVSHIGIVKGLIYKKIYNTILQYWDTYREMIRWRVLLHFQLYNTYTFPHQCYLVKLKMIYKVNRSVDKDKLSTRLVFTYNALQWRHNEHDGASNHQIHDCFSNVY